MKKCTNCKEIKELEHFKFDKRPNKGYETQCKQCYNQKCKETSRTELGVIKGIYRTQNASAKERGHNPPTYTLKVLSKWLYSNGYKKLYDAYKASNYNTHIKPSIDRIDNSISYTIDNIQLTTWLAHCRKDCVHNLAQAKKAWERPINQLSLDNVLIKQFPSMAAAAKATGAGKGNLTYACQGKLKTTKGYKWEYSTKSN